MANDYGALWARILDELDRTDHTAQVQLEIQSAIHHYERERFWTNEDVTKTVCSPSTATLALPARFLELDTIHAERNGHPDPPMTPRTWEWYRNIGGDDANIGESVPDDYVIYEDQFYLYPIPDQTYTIVISYQMSEVTLSASSDTNFWCVEAEELIRQRAKAAFKINYENDVAAKQEAAVYAMKDEDFLCTYERIAYNSLRRLTAKRATGRIDVARF